MINLPNFITIGRLLLVPFLIVMITQGRWLAAVICFVVAGVSDAVDGYIAKRFSLRTELGAYIDPLADKALLMSIYVTLAVDRHAARVAGHHGRVARRDDPGRRRRRLADRAPARHQAARWSAR